MSSYDDDEALFDDLYDDDNTNTESKTALIENEAGADSKIVPPAAAELSSANTVGSITASTGNVAPPPPPPPPAGAVADEASAAKEVGSTAGAASIVPMPGTPSSIGTGTPQPAAGISAGMDQQQAAPLMQMTPEMLLQFQQFQQIQQQQAMFQQGNALPGMPPMPPQENNAGAPPPPSSVMPPSNMGKESGKMFIGGLNWDTTEQGLVEYFSKFGEVLDHTIMRDASTGRSRGFGFLTFKDPSSVDKVIAVTHELDGKLIDPKRAIAREEQDKVGKIFVGGIDPMVTEREFNEFFSQFGSIIDAQLMIDKDTGRSRGFGFITYDSPAAVDRVTVNKYLNLKGKAMEVKRAEPRGQHQQNQMQQQQQQAQLYGAYGAAGYGGQFGPSTYPPGMAAYGQNMTPEMQDYWQRMQWYMYQQAFAASQQQDLLGQPQLPPQNSASGEAPLNPQQQAAKQSESEAEADLDVDSRRSGNRDFQEPRRLNLPKGPRRAPPSGPSGGSRGRGGYHSRSKGYHPYSRGRRP